MLTREQTIKAVEELKANKEACIIFMKLTRTSQEFIMENSRNPIFLRLREGGSWEEGSTQTGMYASVYALDPSYQLPDEEYLELDVDMEEDGLVFRTKEAHRFKIPTQPLYLGNYIFEGYKFEGHPKLHNHYFGYKNPANNYIHYHQVSDRHIKVFATKIVYRKVG